MKSDICCRLLRLPAELRLHIYSHVIPDVPLAEAGTVYKGLIYSCKQIRAEAEPIVVKAMDVKLASMASASLEFWNDRIIFSTPRWLHELQNLEVVVHLDLSSGSPDRFRRHPLHELFGFHFHTLTLQIGRNQNPPRHKNRHGLWLTYLLKPLVQDFAGTMSLKTLIVDCSRLDIHPPANLRPFPPSFLRRLNQDKLWNVVIYASEDDGTVFDVHFERTSDATDFTRPTTTLLAPELRKVERLTGDTDRQVTLQTAD